MSMKKILIDTSSKAKSLNLFILVFFLFTIIIPFVIINFLKNSLVAVFLTSNSYIILLIILINIIFLFLGCYYSQIKIDSYIVNIYSSRFNNKNNLLDIKHDMLNSFYFKKSFFHGILYCISTMLKKIILILQESFFSLF